MLRRVSFFVATLLLAVESAAAIDLFSVPPDPVEGEPNEDEVIDVYGNRVTPAVATYQLDAAGTLYELHSPQTQLPRLGSPKS